MSTKDFIDQYRLLLEGFNDEFLELKRLIDQLLGATEHTRSHLMAVQDQLRLFERRFEARLKNGRFLCEAYKEGLFKK